ncbi:hypothetical protein AMECASPLE_019649 [Ameca splendens]|uniref:Uncharacterized protein n=1 Tax=Ameca splendens TaxID=208324 RepID=A0ABV0XS83_9TELE
MEKSAQSTELTSALGGLCRKTHSRSWGRFTRCGPPGQVQKSVEHIKVVTLAVCIKACLKQPESCIPPTQDVCFIILLRGNLLPNNVVLLSFKLFCFTTY